MTWSCDTKLGTAAPVLCFFPVRTINTRLLLTHAYAVFINISSVLYLHTYTERFFIGQSRLQNPSTLRLFPYVHPRDFAVSPSVYSARILEEFHLIHSLYTTIYHPPYSFITQSVDDGGNIPISIFRYVLLTIYGCLASLYIYIMYMTSWSQLNT